MRATEEKKLWRNKKNKVKMSQNQGNLTGDIEEEEIN